MMERAMRSFLIELDLDKQVNEWADQACLTKSQIVEFLILDKMPSVLIRAGLGFEFRRIATTFDREPDGTLRQFEEIKYYKPKENETC